MNNYYLVRGEKVMNKTKEYLEEAVELVGGQRHVDYGDKKENHHNIAKLWDAYLDINIDAHDVAIMMALLKIARTKLGKRTPDTYIDGAAYMAIAGEIEAVTEKEDEEFKIDLMKGSPER